MVGVLVVLALALITFSFRKPDDGPVASAESAAATVLRPFTIAGERVAQPFRDVYAGPTPSSRRARTRSGSGPRTRRSASRRSRTSSQRTRTTSCKALLAFRDGPRFPDDYTGLAAAVIARPTGSFAQDVVVAVGSNDGVALDAPVVTQDGFLGLVTRVYSRSARVTLLTDEQLAVSALDVKSGAAGHRQARPRIGVDAHLRPRAEEAEGLRRRHDRHRRLALEQARARSTRRGSRSDA